MKVCRHEIRQWPSRNVETWSAEGEEKVKSGYGSLDAKEPGTDRPCCLCPLTGQAAEGTLVLQGHLDGLWHVSW